MKELKMLGIDLGASSGRGIIGYFDGSRLKISENHRFPNEPVMQNGRFSWDILRLLHEIKNSVRKTVLDGENITSIGIDTWGVDYGLLDKNGHLISNPVHYRDSRTDGIKPYADAHLPCPEIYSITGIQSMDFNTIYQLAAEKRDNPELLDYADKLLFIPDLLGYFLTGNCATEYTIASTGALLNAHTKNFSPELLSAFGIPKRLFSSIVFPGYDLGALLPEVIEETGKTDAHVVKIASHDTASAVIAVPTKENNFIYISSGTWSLMGTELSAPIINDASAKLNFTNEGGAEGKIRFLKNIMGLWLIQETRRQYKREGKEYSFGELGELALAAKPRRCLINPDDKIFYTPGNMPKRISDFCRRTGQYVPESVGEIVRCIIDSLALKYRNTAESIAAFMPEKPTAIHVVGGGSQDTLLCRSTASACGLPVCAGPTEATAIGNISSQAIAAGELSGVYEARELILRSFETKIFEPDASEKAEWDDAYCRFLALSRL